MTTPKRRIGLIQTRGIGDLIIALPIADYYLEQGCEVVWPIDENFLHIFESAKPPVYFLPIPRGEGFMFDEPLRVLREVGCDSIISLYSYLAGPEGPRRNVFDQGLFSALKFDEYKYAIANVPFARKWTLQYERDMAREQALYDKLDIQGEYICVHEEGSDVQMTLDLPEAITSKYQVIRMSELTNNPLDWLLTLERASKVFLIDSCFSNLVEQMNLPNEKYLIVRSPIQFTPVYKNGWRFVFVDAKKGA